MNLNNQGEVYVTFDNPSSYGTISTSGLTLTSGNTFLTTTGTSTIPSMTIGQSSLYSPTYNDFWKFDEEFDLLWKSFFDPNALYRPIKEKAVSHPCDIQETDNGLRIEIAAVGLDKEDLSIIVDSETLRVAYRKPESVEEEEKNEYRYFQRSIKKASFDIAWKISSKYDLAKLEASLNKGLLTLDVPFAKENKPKKVTIK